MYVIVYLHGFLETAARHLRYFGSDTLRPQRIAYRSSLRQKYCLDETLSHDVTRYNQLQLYRLYILCINIYIVAYNVTLECAHSSVLPSSDNELSPHSDALTWRAGKTGDTDSTSISDIEKSLRNRHTFFPFNVELSREQFKESLMTGGVNTCGLRWKAKRKNFRLERKRL